MLAQHTNSKPTEYVLECPRGHLWNAAHTVVNLGFKTRRGSTRTIVAGASFRHHYTPSNCPLCQQNGTLGRTEYEKVHGRATNKD